MLKKLRGIATLLAITAPVAACAHRTLIVCLSASTYTYTLLVVGLQLLDSAQVTTWTGPLMLKPTGRVKVVVSVTFGSSVSPDA